MKYPAIPTLLLLALVASLRAEEPASTAPAPTPASDPAARPASLLPGLPAYAPPPPAPPKQPEQPADPDLLVLPTMKVKQKPRPRLSADIVYAPKDFGNLLARQKYSELDRALNKFTLPLFGTSLAERALEEHAREKKAALTSDVLNLSNALESSDPAEAAALKKAVTMP